MVLFHDYLKLEFIFCRHWKFRLLFMLSYKNLKLTIYEIILK